MQEISLCAKDMRPGDIWLSNANRKIPYGVIISNKNGIISCRVVIDNIMPNDIYTFPYDDYANLQVVLRTDVQEICQDIAAWL